ncbi:MAG: two-component system sensor histidine kinase CreC [Spirochaetes bacterium]|nr:two-component system sensor histidine kinase CreC [Spirochaetota bacterium]
MRIRTRILIGFILLYAAGSYFVFDMVVSDIRPRYLEAVEESLNDTAHLMAALIESDMRKGKSPYESLDAVFGAVAGKKISSRIYGLTKTDINLQVYVTDARGIVRYDSKGGTSVGKDFSRWNDVHRTLDGVYGARSSRAVKSDPSTNALYVSAPVRHGGAIAGVVTVVKPENSVTLFMALARRKIIMAAVISCLAFAALGVLLTLWINRPIARLFGYVTSLRAGGRPAFPRLSAAEIRDLGVAFDEMRAELEGKNYIEGYVQALTHELKSPLSSIRGAAELLDDDMTDDRRKIFHRTIRDETGRIDTIIERLLQLTALEKRKHLNNVETIDLEGVAAEVMASLEPQVLKAGIQIKNAVDPGHRVAGEKFLITHAVLNLVKNAVQFTPAGGTVTLSSSAQQEFTLLTVTDTGSGIPDYALERVFDRFYSLPGRDRTRGTGLGLPFVREVALLHGGYVKVRNNDGGPGVTATLSLPAKRS